MEDGWREQPCEEAGGGGGQVSASGHAVYGLVWFFEARLPYGTQSGLEHECSWLWDHSVSWVHTGFSVS